MGRYHARGTADGLRHINDRLGRAIARPHPGKLAAERHASGQRPGDDPDGERYRALRQRVRTIVRREVRGPDAAIDDACQTAWTRRLERQVADEAALAWLVKAAPGGRQAAGRRVGGDLLPARDRGDDPRGLPGRRAWRACGPRREARRRRAVGRRLRRSRARRSPRAGVRAASRGGGLSGARGGAQGDRVRADRCPRTRDGDGVPRAGNRSRGARRRDFAGAAPGDTRPPPQRADASRRERGRADRGGRCSLGGRGDHGHPHPLTGEIRAVRWPRATDVPRQGGLPGRRRRWRVGAA